MENYEILRGSYEENYKFYNEICKTLHPKHPKRKRMLEIINEITEKMDKCLKDN